MSTDDKKGGDVLSLIRGAGEPDKHADLMRAFEKAFPMEIDVAAAVARVARTRFDAFKEKGFTDLQALQLTMKWMWP